MRRVIFIGFGFLLFVCTSIVFGQEIATGIDLDRIKRATVFVMQTRNTGDRRIITCVGSGTLVSRDGLILTNAHNTVTSEVCPGDTIIIAMSLRLDQPPVPIYQAEIAQYDVGLDLALLRIDQELSGRIVEQGTLALPFVELASSSDVVLDQTLTIVGYPGIGNEAVASSNGSIISFIAEPRGGDKSWIKTNAVIAGTMTGGGAYNRNGRLVGIPTTAPVRSGVLDTSCLFIEDTNVDGLINNNDACVPVGDFITVLRPSDFARPLLRAGALGLVVRTITAPSFRTTPVDKPTFSRLFFSPVVADGMPADVVNSLPVGTQGLYLFFDYANMSPQDVYEVRVTRDGNPEPNFSLSPVRWSGGERGMWYVGATGQPWPNGTYEFRLFINGVAEAENRITLGGPPPEVPTFTNTIFGLEDGSGNILGAGYVLPAGQVVSARFIYRNMTSDLNWSAIWYYNGNEVARSSDPWQHDANGSLTIGLRPDGGLLPGNYRVNLYINDRLSETADFTIAGTEDMSLPRVFTDMHFATANSPEDALRASPVNTFTDRIDTLYAMFDWERIAPGTLWTIRWSVDNAVFYEYTAPWNAQETGQDFIMQLTASGQIPDGTYLVELLVNNVLLESATASIGIGQLPIDRFAQAGGIQLSGQIVDAETGEGIEGATFILISQDFSIEDFAWDENQVYALATTDRNGQFEMDRPLEFLAPYSVMIAAEGYLPISGDGFEIEPEDGTFIDMYIEMTRD